MQTVSWFGWSFTCAWTIRIGVVALLTRRFGSLSYPLAYLTWIGLLAAGSLIIGATGFQIYGYDPKNPWQFVGYVIFGYSPLGLPLLFGAPIVLILDLLTRYWRALINISHFR